MKKINLKISYMNLKESHRKIREQQTEHNKIRIHRAISWLKDFEQIEQLDLAFIQLWISFNAAYAGDFDEQQSERVKLKNFLSQIIELDNNKDINKTLFSKFSGPVRTLIDNKFAFEPFWQAMRAYDSSDKWKEQFANHKKIATKVMIQGDTSTLLSIIFDRIYTIRNQLIHGGSTFSSSINRKQLQDACQILAELIPMIIQIMINNPNCDFGEIAYPVVG